MNGFDLDRIHVLFITEDNCPKERMRSLFREENVSGEVFGEKERREWFISQGLEEFYDLIPRASHAETSFGLLYMYANPEFEYGVLLDDDTEPVDNGDFFGTHLRNLAYSGVIDVVSSDKRWVNVLFQCYPRLALYPRGYPYSAMGERVEIQQSRISHVVCSQGLWTNVPDLDAVRILAQGNLEGLPRTRTDESDFHSTFAVAANNYLTISSMNLAFKSEIVPAFYQLPMDDNRWGIGRFDDIWSGLFLKKVADVLRKGILTGHPLCIHDKAPRSTFRDLRAEWPALELNEHLWRIVDDARPESSWDLMYLSIARTLRSAAPEMHIINRDFLVHCARSMERWVECCRTIEDST